jgi:hypothetical protein
MSAVVQALPPSTRKRLVPLVHAQFETLIAAMSASGAAGAGTGSEGAEWVRDLFLRRIDQAARKPKASKTAVPAADALDIEF